MRWFFYGTLMDAEVREIVLDRVVDPRSFVEAYVKGFRRVAVRNEDFPALVRAPGELVAGLMGALEAEEDEARMRLYEGDEFEVVETDATTIDGETMRARMFVADRGLDVLDAAWEPKVWRSSLAREATIAEARRLMASAAF